MDQIHICVGEVIGSTPPPHTRGWGGAVAANLQTCRQEGQQSMRFGDQTFFSDPGMLRQKHKTTASYGGTGEILQLI